MIQPDVVFFDMDHTIVAIDTSVSWKRFLVNEGLAPEQDLAKADHFLHLYHNGRYPVDDFVRFQYNEFVGHTPEEICALTRRHFNERVRSFIYPDAREVVRKCSSQGVPTVLVTGTNRFIAEPIVEAIGITTLLATEAEIVNGRLTGRCVEPFLHKDTKLQAVKEHCRALQTCLSRASSYADSINDLEMLESVGLPVVVNPSKRLLEEAQARGWPVKHWSMKGTFDAHSG